MCYGVQAVDIIPVLKHIKIVSNNILSFAELHDDCKADIQKQNHSISF
jgi:hypothetical protein